MNLLEFINIDELPTGGFRNLTDEEQGDLSLPSSKACPALIARMDLDGEPGALIVSTDSQKRGCASVVTEAGEAFERVEPFYDMAVEVASLLFDEGSVCKSTLTGLGFRRIQ